MHADIRLFASSHVLLSPYHLAILLLKRRRQLAEKLSRPEPTKKAGEDSLVVYRHPGVSVGVASQIERIAPRPGEEGEKEKESGEGY